MSLEREAMEFVSELARTSVPMRDTSDSILICDIALEITLKHLTAYETGFAEARDAAVRASEEAVGKDIDGLADRASELSNLRGTSIQQSVIHEKRSAIISARDNIIKAIRILTPSTPAAKDSA